MRRVVLALAAAGLLACSKSSTESPPPAASSKAPVASASTPVVPSAAPAASAGVAPSWHGTYKSAASALSVPPEWKKVHWSDTQSTTGLGDGAMTLTVDAATGRVSGALEGPLGPATLDGAVADGKLSATVRRKDPTDHGFTGTMVGSMSGDHAEGTMDVSLGTAGVVRSASFVLTPGSGG
jgi:hypothetical protein